MRILVVEDELPIADFVRRGLEAEGYSVDHASDGVEGERLAVAGDPDLVILDLMLPGRDGLSVLQGIRRTKPSLPVILLTARDAVNEKVEGLDTGANTVSLVPSEIPSCPSCTRPSPINDEGLTPVQATTRAGPNP